METFSSPPTAKTSLSSLTLSSSLITSSVFKLSEEVTSLISKSVLATSSVRLSAAETAENANKPTIRIASTIIFLFVKEIYLPKKYSLIYICV